MSRHPGLTMVLSVILATLAANPTTGQGQDDPNWWLTPHRLLQTNLREIDATMDTDQYVREVKEFGANIVLFNVGGIVANYPTELKYHWRNTFMTGDLVGETLVKLHAEQIKMIGRFDFSKINEKYAAQHPEWLYVSEKGEHVNYNGQVHTCVMGGYQQDYLLKILVEALTRYPLDGVFFNMIGFPQVDYSRVFHGICQCENCKQSFKNYCGMSVPKTHGDPEVLQKHKQWKQIQINRQFERVRHLIKSIRENTVICTYTVDHIDVIRKESGAPLGEESWDDVDRAQWTLLTTENKQLANASVHFYQMIFRHSAAAPYLHSRRLWQEVVNGAWLDFYCIGPLQRLEDRAGIEPVSDIYRFHGANEKWMLHTESAADVGIVRHDGDDYWGWVQMLSENHVPFDLVSLQHSELSHYKALIVPESARIKTGQAKMLDAYVEDGGKLLLSGKIPEALACLGQATLRKTWPMRHSMYVRIRADDKVDLKTAGLRDFDLVQLRGDFHEYSMASGGDQMLRLIHDVMYGPPEKCYIKSESDIPALFVHRYGTGKVACFPWQIGAMYREWGNHGHPMLGMGVLDNLLETGRRLTVDTSPLVEVTHRRDPSERFEWIALYNHSGRLEKSYHAPIPIHNVVVDLRPPRAIKQVSSLTNKVRLTWTEGAKGRKKIVLPELNVFEIVLVEYESQVE